MVGKTYIEIESLKASAVQSSRSQTYSEFEDIFPAHAFNYLSFVNSNLSATDP